MATTTTTQKAASLLKAARTAEAYWFQQALANKPGANEAWEGALRTLEIAELAVARVQR